MIRRWLARHAYHRPHGDGVVLVVANGRTYTPDEWRAVTA